MTPDKESSEEDRDKFRESDNEMLSPKNVFNQDSNDGLSGDERKSKNAYSKLAYKIPWQNIPLTSCIYDPREYV